MFASRATFLSRTDNATALLAGPMLSLSFALAISPARAQESGLPDTITNATLESHLGLYRSSRLCETSELTLWSCSAGEREYALCSSHVVTRTAGHFQYRASKAGKKVFIFPEAIRPPAGLFTYEPTRNGDAAVVFVNGGYQYRLIDPLRDKSSILITNRQGKTNEIQCNDNQTLQLNYTMRLMHQGGVWAR